MIAGNRALVALAGGIGDDLTGFDLSSLGLGEVAALLAAGEAAGQVSRDGAAWRVTLQPVAFADEPPDSVVMRLEPVERGAP